MKIDLHLHSKYSKRPSQWILQKIGCPESFSEPEELYRLAKKTGMSGMTLTDHNCIDGCLEIAHLPNTFISEEVTTYFPEDRCKLHVLVYNINERIHREIQKVRENVFDLISYLTQEGIIHALAHPLYSVNDKLTVEHFEKFVLMFRTFELNGARDELQNHFLTSILGGLSRERFDALVDRHGIVPQSGLFWKKHFIGGSDDHSSLGVARMHTDAPEARTMDDFITSIGTSRCRPAGTAARPETLAHNLYGIAYQFYNHRLNLSKYTEHDLLLRFLEQSMRPAPQGSASPLMKVRGLFSRRRRRFTESDKVEDVLRRESERMIFSDPELKAMVHEGPSGKTAREDQWFRFVEQLSNKVIYHFGENLFGNIGGVNVFSIFNSIGAAGSLYFLLAPYFVAFHLFGRDRVLARNVHRRMTDGPAPDPDRIRVAHFTDTFYEVNGVAWTLRQQAELAALTDKELDIITCADDQPFRDGRVVNFKPVSTYELPEYPEMKVIIPPFLQMVKHVYEGEYSFIHSATPGPIGLAALGIARILGLNITGTYHTAIPQYAAYLTGDQGVEQLVWRYVLWYYDQMNLIYVPSQETGDELIAKGINSDKIRLYPRGVDLERFSPGNRNGFYHRHYGLEGELKLLYVGRVSKEKNLALLVDVFKELSERRSNLHLVVVGEGPYLEEMKEELAGRPVTFTGYLTGRDLAEAFASADLFVFPSTTDTFGNVILEAQASGLPVVVTDVGGPKENILPGETGVVTKGGDHADLRDTVLSLVDDRERLGRMAEAARRYSENRSFEQAFLEQWRMFGRELKLTGREEA